MSEPIQNANLDITESHYKTLFNQALKIAPFAAIVLLTRVGLTENPMAYDTLTDKDKIELVSGLEELKVEAAKKAELTGRDLDAARSI